MNTEWRNLNYYGKTFDNFSISSNGDLRNNKTGRVLKPSTNKSGYYVFVVRLYQKGKMQGIVAHKAVANAFLDNPHCFSQINHKDGNKKNNSVENLEWCTPKQNNKHAIENRLHTFEYCEGELCNLSKLKEKDVLEIRGLYETKKYSQRQLAKIFNCSRENISKIVRKNSWKHLGG
jgi:predicted XRE-type DNA-binding protein